MVKKNKKSFQKSSQNVADLKELTRLLPEMVRFQPSSEDLDLLKDGGVAIIDQWICAHARYCVHFIVIILFYVFDHSDSASHWQFYCKVQ